MCAADRRTGPGDGLRDDPAIRELIEALALSSRFHFYLVIANSAAQASALPELLAWEIAAQYRVSKEFVRIDLAKETVPTALGRLLKPDSGEDRACHVLDATGASSLDLAWWSLLFQRMNERRNLISASLPGSLVLVLLDDLENLFARAAPDFWSIRSMIVRIAAGGKATRSVDSVNRTLSGGRSLDKAGQMRLTSAQFGEFAQELAATFNQTEMTSLLRGFPIWNEGAPGSTGDLAIELVRWAERNGRLLELLDRVTKQRPRNRGFRNLRDSFATTTNPAEESTRGQDGLARDDLMSRLSRLLPSQFETVVFRLGIPSEHLSSPSAPQASRAIEVLRFLDSRDELDRLTALLQDT